MTKGGIHAARPAPVVAIENHRTDESPEITALRPGAPHLRSEAPSHEVGRATGGAERPDGPGAPAAATTCLVAEIRRRILVVRFAIAVEDHLQDQLAEVLAALGPAREHDLAPHGRVDFWFPDARLALEVKVQGSPSSVARQLVGYAQHPSVRALLLVTGRRRLGSLVPPLINGKPVDVVSLWSGQL